MLRITGALIKGPISATKDQRKDITAEQHHSAQDQKTTAEHDGRCGLYQF
jgi:hypothetical protein